MNAQDCLNTLRELRDVTFSTVAPDGKPQARIIDVMLAEEGSLIFCTSRGKDFHAQLMGSGWVAVTGLTRDFKMIRLNGKAKLLPEKKFWIDRIFEANPSMSDVYPGESRYILDPFCIDEGNLEWVDKDVVMSLPTWAGDRIFLDLLARDVPFFSLKLAYAGDTLVQAVLNGEDILSEEKIPAASVEKPGKT